MRKSKILSVAIAAAMVSSLAAATAISANATDVSNDGIADATKVGICGAYNGWGQTSPDVAMTETSKGIWEGSFTIDNVTEDMFTEHSVDDVKDGKKGIEFKVRCDDSWDNSWGLYEKEHARTFNSQSNCIIEDKDCVVGQSLTVNVKFDTTQADPQAIADNKEDADYGVDPTDPTADIWNFWQITYTSTTGSGAGAGEESKTEESSATEESKTEESKTEESKTEESKADEPATSAPAAETSATGETPSTGDTTSAVALVAVVLASLGTAVVMTKKASAKD